MNKKFIFVLSLLLTGIFVYGGSIVVNKPHPGQEAKAGSRLDIKWSFPGCNAPAVKINIFKNAIAQPNFVLQLTGPNNGFMPWQIPANFPPGKYVLRIKTDGQGCLGDSGVFNVVSGKGPGIGIIQVEALKPPPNQNIPGHRAPAIGEPSNASFNIKAIHYGVGKDGRIDAMWVVVGYHSKTPFSFSNYKGHPSDGPAYMNCKITIPYWPDDLWPAESKNKGPFQTKDIYNQRLSVKYIGQNNLKCTPDILNAGTGEFELIFSPAHSGKVEGLYTRQRMPASNPWQGHTDWCMKTYLPKMALRLFVHTKEGVKQIYKEFYLDRGTENKSVTIPGEVSICSAGIVHW